MKKLLIYDSYFGNTEKVAQSIAKSISAKVIKVTDAKSSDLEEIEVLIIGSPTQGGRATESIQKFFNNLPEGVLKNIKIAVFDTRVLEKDLNFLLRTLVKKIGYAAPKMADILASKGADLFVLPEGFIVEGKKGPLAEGELERAEKWIQL